MFKKLMPRPVMVGKYIITKNDQNDQAETDKENPVRDSGQKEKSNSSDSCPPKDTESKCSGSESSED